MEYRDYVVPDDLHGLAGAVLAHRLIPSTDATMSGRTATAILQGILDSVPMPAVRPR